MAWDKGFNFRGSSGYVVDGADETYVLDTDDYPTTRNACTFGEEDEWTYHLDRDNTVDRRLAGLIGETVNIPARFRVDLPEPGDFSYRLALGDAASAQSNMKLATKDDTTTLDTYSVSTSGAKQYFDAVGVEYSDLDWPGSNTAVTRTFASSIFRIQENGVASGASVIAHLFLSQIVAADVVQGWLPLYGGGGRMRDQILPSGASN